MLLPLYRHEPFKIVFLLNEIIFQQLFDIEYSDLSHNFIYIYININIKIDKDENLYPTAISSRF